jgi:hypothetical protein
VDEVLFYERLEFPHDVFIIAEAADNVDVIEREAAPEDREPAEERFFRWPEEVMAPLDRVPERLMPRRHVLRAADEQARSFCLEKGQELPRRQEARSAGGQLDRERKPVQSDADLCDCGRVVFVQDKDVSGGPGAVDEKADRFIRPKRFQPVGGCRK